MQKTRDYSSETPAPLKSGRRTRAAALVVLLASAAMLSPHAVRGQADEERELEAVRAEIEAIEQRMARQSAARDDGVAALKRAELGVAEVSGELARLRARAGEQRARQAALEERTAAAEARLASEREALSRQVRMSYMSGRQELFRLLLSQEEPARLGRMMRYYDYFNRARTRRIAAVAKERAELGDLARQSRIVRDELEALEAATQRELEALERTRDERRRAVAALDEALAAGGDAVERLREEEERLAELVAELGAALAGFPVDAEEPFAELKGQLAWPVRGRMTGEYGARRDDGPLRWNGVLLEAPEGAAVRAVHHGRVAFSDWLPGLGLLIIVDHGAGYMSLYGHNQTLLKESGDWVAPGEAIAEVGDSGGRSAPSLYFEIRMNGEPQDPQEWIPSPPDPG